MKLSNLAGLHQLTTQHAPDIIFLQEVVLTTGTLQNFAERMGYTAFSSTSISPKQSISTLCKAPATTTEIVPGYLQAIETQGLKFLHFHAHAGSDGFHDREELFAILPQARITLPTMTPLKPYWLGTSIASSTARIRKGGTTTRAPPL